jgi:hypothetical protein
MDESVNDKLLKKYLSNTINSTINKKTFKNESKLDEILEKSNNILNLFNIMNKRIEKIENILSKNENFINNNESIIQKVDSNINLLKKINENILKEENIQKFNDNDIEDYDFIDTPEEIKDKKIELDKDKKIESEKDKKIELDKDNKDKKNIKSKKIKTQNDTEEELSKKYIDVKIQHFIFENKFVKKCLDMNSINGDIQLFKKMYIENISKEYIPIRHIKKKFQYWINDHMKDDDTNGEYIINVILKNIELCYMKINNTDNYGDDIDQFLKNQEHINKLNDNKYKEKIMSQIIKLIDI